MKVVEFFLVSFWSSILIKPSKTICQSPSPKIYFYCCAWFMRPNFKIMSLFTYSTGNVNNTKDSLSRFWMETESVVHCAPSFPFGHWRLLKFQQSRILCVRSIVVDERLQNQVAPSSSRNLRVVCKNTMNL